MTRQDAHHEQQATRIHAEIAALGPCLPGTISARRLRCGNPRCRCRNEDRDQRHGPYHYWTRKISGKTASRLLSPEQAERYQPWLDNDKRLHALTRQLEGLAIRAADTPKGGGRNNAREVRNERKG